jgi:ABC-type transport system involved in multi-copper enzyme maturation permease subunit
MNATIGKALLLDIFYQTLDNRMFRLLVGMVLVLILPTFLVSFGDDSISLLFGWKKIGYEGIFRTFYAQAVSEHPAQRVVGDLQIFFVDAFAGTLGLLFCVAATAFFLPRALEKGAAENVFAKPVSRGTVLLTRYLAGLFFVGLLAVLLVFGMHAGLMIVSGYSDPGFLWSAVTLVYLFGILHAVSIVIGVFTRSSVTALLTTMMFFAFNGCVQGGWVAYQTSAALNEAQRTAKMDAAPDAAPTTEDSSENDYRTLLGALSVAHYVLPKTMDAPIIAHKLRRSLEAAPAFEDDVAHLSVRAVPPGFVREGSGTVDGDGIVWRKAEAGDLSFTLRRIERHVDRGEGKRPRSLFPSTVADERKESLEAEGTTVTTPQGMQLSGGARTSSLTWQPAVDGNPRHREAHYFSANADWLYVLEIDGPPSEFEGHSKPDETLAFQFLSRVQLPGNVDFKTWYEDQMRWTGPVRFNLWCSIGATLSFVIALLLCAWWKLARIDF